MPNKNHPLAWVVVADRSKAKIYRVVKFPKLEEIAYLDHPESRLHNQDLTSDKPGRGFQSVGIGRYSYEPDMEPKQQEAEKFAAYLGHHLSSAEKKGEFNRLYLFAGPSFLGMLRPHLSPETKKTVIAEVAKEFTSDDIASIERHISEQSY